MFFGICSFYLGSYLRQLLGAFAKLRKVDYELRHVCLSVRVE